MPNHLIKKLTASIMALTLICGFGVQVAEAEQISFYVSPNGDDKNVGTKEQPFQSLQKAREAIRELKASQNVPSGGITVYLREGDYQLRESFVLDSKDSGTEKCPITYTAYENEQVRLLGGELLQSTLFTAVTNADILDRISENARSNILQYDLKGNGITDYGVIEAQSMYRRSEVQSAELFFNGNPMTLGRWPNEGYVQTGDVETQGNAAEKQGALFHYTDDRPIRWSKAKDIHIAGLFKYVWLYENMGIQSIDTENKQIITAQPPAMGIDSDKNYYYYNLLEEVDSPGEWYLDRESGLLYLYPSSDVNDSEIALSMLKDYFIRLENASFIHIENITFAYGRHNGISVKSGNDNVISGCVIQSIGGLGISISGTNNGIKNSKIFHTGLGAADVIGGDFDSLTPANNFVENNEIYAYNRTIKTLNGGVSTYGVGMRIAHNLIHDAPHIAIICQGNNTIVEYNEIYNVCTDTQDSGAIYMGQSWTRRGNIIRYNYIHDMGKDAVATYGVTGIYLDDQLSGTKVYGNVIYNLFRPALIGGGCDNTFENNLMIDCNKSITIDNRGENWQKPVLEPGQLFYDGLMAVPYKREPWSSQYPGLVDILNDNPGVPKRNVTLNNVALNCGELSIDNSVRVNGSIEDPWIPPMEDIGFENKDELNFTLHKDSAVHKKFYEFDDIPYADMGLIKTEPDENAQIRKEGNFKKIIPKNQSLDLDPKQITFSWEPCSGLSQYRLIVSDDKDFNTLLFDEIVKGTSKTLTYFPYGKTFYWKVQAFSIAHSLKSEKWNEGGAGSFGTYANGGIDRTAINHLIEQSIQIVKDADIGNVSGQYPRAAKVAMEAEIEKAKRIADNPNVQMQDLDRGLDTLTAALEVFQSAVVPTIRLVNLDEAIQDKEGWDYQGEMLQFTQEGMALLDKERAQSVFGYKARKFETDEMVQFSMKVEGDFIGWTGFGVRAANTNALAWSNNYSYLFVIKKDIIELQKYSKTTQGFLTVVDNQCIKSNTIHNVQVGALNTKKGVNILLKVDGNEIINFTDESGGIKNSGYFNFYDFISPAGGNAKVIIEKAGEVQEIPEYIQSALQDLTVLYLDNPMALVNGKKQSINENEKVKPFVLDGRTFVPLRFVSMSLGAEISWNEESKQATIQDGNHQIDLQPDRSSMLNNGVLIEMDCAPILQNGRLYVPIRAIAKALDKAVFWDERGLIIIGDEEKVLNLDHHKAIIDDIYHLFDS